MTAGLQVYPYSPQRPLRSPCVKCNNCPEAGYTPLMGAHGATIELRGRTWATVTLSLKGPLCSIPCSTQGAPRGPLLYSRVRG